MPSDAVKVRALATGLAQLRGHDAQGRVRFVWMPGFTPHEWFVAQLAEREAKDGKH